MTKRLACILALAMAGCASTKSGNGVADAATAPLSDLNLVRAEIPPALAEALKGPYKAPAGSGCEAIAAEVGQLEAVLGADLDVPPSAARPSLIERGGHAAGEAAVGALRSTTESVIPFRGWVRKGAPLAAVASLLAYILWHPVQTWVGLPFGRPEFLDPAFLGVIAWLGLACTLSRIRSGSIWPAVVIHWGVVVMWKSLYGG